MIFASRLKKIRFRKTVLLISITSLSGNSNIMLATDLNVGLEL